MGHLVGRERLGQYPDISRREENTYLLFTDYKNKQQCVERRSLARRYIRCLNFTWSILTVHNVRRNC